MREKIYIFIFGVFLGIALGYGWRMAHVEPHYDREIKYVTQTQKRLTRDICNIELRLTLIEDRLKGLSSRKGK